MTRLIPAPDIKSDLRATHDRHTSMNCLLVSPPLPVKITPKHRRPRFRFESHTTLLRLAALDEPTPPFVLEHRYPREVRPAPNTICCAQVDHERADAPGLFARRRPVVVVCVMATHVISLGPESLDESLRWPALDAQGALLDALHRLVAVDERFLGFANGFVGCFYAFVEDG